MKYLARAVDADIERALSSAPAVALEGPKGVGKTVTATRWAQSAWQLDDAADRGALAADPRLIREAEPPVLLDEWQRHPPIWDAVRRWVDDGAAAGSALLTGSATPVSGVDTHTGAGRIVSLRMRPMALFERGSCAPSVSLGALLSGDDAVSGTTEFGLRDYLDEICASGFPGIRRMAEETRLDLLDGYLRRIVDRDLRDQGLSVRRPGTLRRWLTAFAAATSTTTAYSRILDATTGGDGTQPAKTTTIAYRDHLSAIWLLDPVPGWSPSFSPFARLQQAPKHHLADPALAARLLRLHPEGMVRGRGAAMAGPLFEALATLTVRVAAQTHRGDVGHLRTGNGDHEVDLIVEGRDGRALGIEVKLARDIGDADVRHLLWLRERMGDDVANLVVLHAGPRAYRRPDGVCVVPLALLGV